MGRWEDEKSANALYKRKFRKLTLCVYCGAPRQCLDHVFPLWAAVGLVSHPATRAELGPNGLCLVPCCTNCNGLGGRKVFTSILKKRAYIQDRIRRKYGIDRPVWDKKELGKLGYALRAYIVRAQAKTDEHWCRALWPRSRKLFQPSLL